MDLNYLKVPTCLLGLLILAISPLALIPFGTWLGGKTAKPNPDQYESLVGRIDNLNVNVFNAIVELELAPMEVVESIIRMRSESEALSHYSNQVSNRIPTGTPIYRVRRSGGVVREKTPLGPMIEVEETAKRSESLSHAHKRQMLEIVESYGQELVNTRRSQLWKQRQEAKMALACFE